MKVIVTISPEDRAYAAARGYDVEPYEAETLPGCPWMFWHRVKPLTGKHARVVDLPPMFKVEAV